jgi:bifunctional isochorismate lyase/aryl carrier protein
VHKEAYFTPGNLRQQSKTFMESLGELPQRRKALPAPGKSALLVLDMQDYFLDESSHAYIPSATAILPGIRRLVDAWSKRKLPVIYTRHLNTAQNARGMARWWKDLIREGSPLSAITSNLDTTSAEVIEKCQYDAFLVTSLEQRLYSLGVSQVLICGVMTHLCCESTARSAFMRGFDVFFTVDGTATYMAAFHAASLLNLAHGFATPVLIDEVISVVNQNEA